MSTHRGINLPTGPFPYMTHIDPSKLLKRNSFLLPSGYVSCPYKLKKFRISALPYNSSVLLLLYLTYYLFIWVIISNHYNFILSYVRLFNSIKYFRDTLSYSIKILIMTVKRCKRKSTKSCLRRKETEFQILKFSIECPFYENLPTSIHARNIVVAQVLIDYRIISLLKTHVTLRLQNFQPFLLSNWKDQKWKYKKVNFDSQ